MNRERGLLRLRRLGRLDRLCLWRLHRLGLAHLRRLRLAHAIRPHRDQPLHDPERGSAEREERRDAARRTVHRGRGQDEDRTGRAGERARDQRGDRDLAPGRHLAGEADPALDHQQQRGEQARAQGCEPGGRELGPGLERRPWIGMAPRLALLLGTADRAAAFEPEHTNGDGLRFDPVPVLDRVPAPPRQQGCCDQQCCRNECEHGAAHAGAHPPTVTWLTAARILDLARQHGRSSAGGERAARRDCIGIDPVRDPRSPRDGRDGRDLPRARRSAWPASSATSCSSGSCPSAPRDPRVRRDVPRRGAARRAAPPPEHRAGLRHRSARRFVLLHDGVRPRRERRASCSRGCRSSAASCRSATR